MRRNLLARSSRITGRRKKPGLPIGKSGEEVDSVQARHPIDEHIGSFLPW